MQRLKHSRIKWVLVALLFLLFLFTEVSAQGQKQTVHLYLHDTTVNYGGKPIRAIAINGTIPGPELHFTIGDTAEIFVHNQMKEESSLHWHGLILPNDQDGVPYLTTTPIKAGTTARYSFPLVQTGTYWYHSHTGLQEQLGQYGAFIIHENKPTSYKEKTLLLSDWSNENPKQIDRSLHAATDWYMIKKNAVQGYGEAIVEGHLDTKLISEWKRMHAMDVSDVYYEAFLMNGAQQSSMTLQAGDTLRLRVINGSASTYFWLQFAGGKMWVVASDGAEVVPVAIDRLIVGVSETYDVLVVLPKSGSFEFRATSEDRIGYTSLFIGEGDTIFAPQLPRLDYFEGMVMMNDMMNLDANIKPMAMHMQNQMMDMNVVMYPEYLDPLDSGVHAYHSGRPKTLNYEMLRAPEPTVFPEGEWTEYQFMLTGNMNRYVWTINNRTVSESDKILIKKGEK
ncbi:MAG: multicopper oxidase domain-containing protein, partial [Bacteroidia bacterium]